MILPVMNAQFMKTSSKGERKMMRELRISLVQGIVVLLAALSVLFTSWAPIRAQSTLAMPCEKSLASSSLNSQIGNCPELALLDLHTTPIFPTSTGGPDQYGYIWDDSFVMAWKEVVTGTGGDAGVQIFPLAELPDLTVDDQVVGPIDIGFDFKFYENTYSQIYISSNGLIGFEANFSGNLAGASNLTIPFDYYVPQNFLAPFWDDIIIGGNHNEGKVAYKVGSDAQGPFFVVEWYQVTKTDLSGALTFEVILRENGNIQFQYLELGGDLKSATVGIEDLTGMDGLAYIYNAAGLMANKAISIVRPLPSARVKAFPTTQGGFNIRGQSSYPLTIRNTGDFGDDIYDLSVFINSPGWQVALLDTQGNVVSDHDQDAFHDTGLLAQNEDFPLTVRVFAPANANVNSQVIVLIIARSSKDINKAQTAKIASAIPAPFALTYRRGLLVFSELISPYSQTPAVEFEYYAGGTFGIANGPDNQFVGFSLVSGGSLYTNLEYMLVNSLGQVLFEQAELLTENNAGLDVRDNAPVVVTAHNGNIGVAWVRRLTRLTDFRTNINIYFAVLDPSGVNFIQTELNVTQNDIWSNTEDPDLMELENLRIEVVEDELSGQGRYHLAWIEKHTRNTGLITTDVAHAVYADSGSVINPASLFTSFVSDRIDYFGPTLAAYYDHQVLLFYFVNDANDPLSIKDWIVFARLDSAGEVLQNETSLFDVDGEEIDAIQLSDGSIGMVWLNSDTNCINTAVLAPNLAKPQNVVELPTPDGRPGQAVSITRGMAGQAILTWMDGGLLERLYYAVIDSMGNPVVLPVAFKYRQGEPALETVAGQGNAIYSTRLANYLPAIRK